jgi:hypothetical protein
MKDVSQVLQIIHWRLLASAAILVFCCFVFSIRGGDSYRVNLMDFDEIILRNVM